MDAVFEQLLRKVKYEKDEPVISITMTPNGHAFYSITDDEATYTIERKIDGTYESYVQEIIKDDSKQSEDAN